jgi:hypothetical protein
MYHFLLYSLYCEPVFLNVYGAQESIPRDQFRQPICSLAGRYDNPILTRCLAPIDFFKNSSSVFCTGQQNAKCFQQRVLNDV